MRIGVDSGGTFTDIALYDETAGTIAVWKLGSTPGDPSQAIAAGVAEAISRFAPPGAVVGYFGHGTTVATNAVIERKGALTGLLTTEGFRDVLEIGRQTRPSQFNLRRHRAAALAGREHRLEVAERTSWDGEVLRPLDTAGVLRAAKQLRAAGVEAIAVSLINSYRNPDHERAIGVLLRELLPDVFVTLSTEIAPEYREYERTATAVANAYVGPLMARYLARLG
ncbi:MAG: hydantoinase/oxoprolinase family protein, partial [Acetobacteraceae bacterium]|nr:hydantoinase/oxoprolinase family protein [Acetobacteraceae bacterium]